MSKVVRNTEESVYADAQPAEEHKDDVGGGERRVHGASGNSRTSYEIGGLRDGRMVAISREIEGGVCLFICI